MDYKKISCNVRQTILHMITKSKSSHIWSAYSIVDMLVYIYGEEFKNWDKLIFSKWHAWSALYATLAENWKIDKDVLINNYCQNWQKIGWHVTLRSIDWVDATAWSLWHWLPMWIWMAIWIPNNNIYVILWDWEINEWSVWEWFLFAPQKKLSNLIVVIDRNWQQALWHTKNILAINNLDKILINLWWNVLDIDWNNFDDIWNAFLNLSKDKPNIIIANTIKWKWVSFMEDNIDFHYKTPNEEQYKNALFELNNN
jgi:transketolase